MTEKRFCSTCQKEGLKSTVRSFGTMVTLMAFSPYWDEDGVYHFHDANRRTTAYSCSKGHNWSTSTFAECPAGDFPK